MRIDLTQTPLRAIDGRFDGRIFAEGSMAEWKRLTAIAGHPVDVNMDQVAFIECSQDVTELHFISDGHLKGTVILEVRENLEDINMMRTT
jgi:hypothetical protein